MAKIVIIEDEENLRFTIRKCLERVGHTVVEAGSVESAWDRIWSEGADLVLTDVNLPGQSGLECIKRLRSEGFGGAVIVVTAYGTVETAVSAIKEGADEFLQKPLSLEELKVVVARALENKKVRSRLDLYERLERTRDGDRTPLGSSPAWLKTMELVQRFAKLPLRTGTDLTTILLLGETGAGKGMLAKFLHESSEQRGQPFVHVNCSALPANLIESELFGHEKGAFTDAKDSRPGLFELAEGGTIFLDEIGDMPLELQSKLLIVVEHGVFRRIGGNRERRISARIIAATNRELIREVEAGRFRRDLYYRLNALTVPIPSLKERGDDAVGIARAMVEASGRRLGRPGLRLTDEALTAIRSHLWPGNVRELSNVVQRAALLADSDEIGPADLMITAAAVASSHLGPQGSVARESLNEASLDQGSTTGVARNVESLRFDFSTGLFTADAIERHLVCEALRYCHGNVSRAARVLGMNRSSLRYRIEQYHLESFVEELAAQS